MKEKLLKLYENPVVRKRTAIGASVLLVFSFLTASTQTSTSAPEFNAGLDRAVGNIDSKSGELKVGTARDCDSLDPAQTYDSWCAAIQRLYTRNLVSFAGKAGVAGLEPVPDLAASSPTVEDDAKLWTFKLRSGLTWDDGTPITSGDVKFSFERLYDDLLQSPVSNESLCLLSTCSSGKPDYLGPYIPEVGEIQSIQTPDENTVVIRLTRSFAEFDKLLATANFGIVSMKKDTELRAAGIPYGQQPAASGPFKLTTVEGGYLFVRNDKWQQASDPIRFPLLEQINWKIFGDTDAVDNALKNGEIDLRIDGGLGKTGRDYVLGDRKLRAQVDNPTIGYTNFLALIGNVAPLDRQPCREAIAYAINKTALAATHGGTDVSVVANSMTPTNIAGYQKNFNAYPTGKNFTGNLDAAKRKLIECGYPDGFTVKFGFSTLGTGPQVYSVLQQSLGQVGIVVDAVPFDDFAAYLSTGIGSPEAARNAGIGMVASGWSADYNSPLSFWSPLIDGRKIKVMNNSNLALVNDGRINELLDQIELGKSEDFTSIDIKLEQYVAEKAVYIPFASDNEILFRPSYLANVYVQQALGSSYDLVNIGVNPK